MVLFPDRHTYRISGSQHPVDADRVQCAYAPQKRRDGHLHGQSLDGDKLRDLVLSLCGGAAAAEAFADRRGPVAAVAARGVHHADGHVAEHLFAGQGVVLGDQAAPQADGQDQGQEFQGPIVGEEE